MIGFLSRRRGWWRLMLLGIILAILGSYVSPVRSYLSKSSAIQREQSVTEDMKLERDRLQQDKENLLNNNFVEQVARKDLGMVKPGEQPYVVKDLNTPDQGAMEVPAAADASLTDRILETVGSLLP